MIPHDDRGLTLGDGLFETLLARDGELLQVAEHLGRLAAGCAVLGLPPPDRAASQAIMARALVQSGLQQGQAAVRLTLTAGSGGRGLDRPSVVRTRLFATAAPYVRTAAPARLATAEIRRNASSPASRLKTLAYLDNVLARRAAGEAGADEALMLNTAGDVAGATAANVFWVRQDQIFTPALACGVLAGVMRGQVMAAAQAMGRPVAEVALPLDEMRAADVVFLTNSLIGVREVAAWDGRILGTSRLVQALSARIN